MGKYRFDEIAVNSTEKKKPEKADKHTYIGLEHLDPGRLQVTRYGSDVAPIGEKLIMRKGDVLFGKRRAYQKKVAIAPFDGIFSAHGMVLRPNEKVIDRDFFPFFISSDYFLDAAIAISVGSLSPTINWRDLRELEFELPNLVKQRELAKILWAMEETKKSYRNLLQLSDKLVKSQFREMFGDPVNNRFGFPITTLNEVAAEPLSYGSVSSATDYDGNTRYIRITDINENGSLGDDLKSAMRNEDKYLLNEGDLLFARTGATVGKTCIYRKCYGRAIFAGFLIRLIPNTSIINPDYLFHFTKSDYYWDFVKSTQRVVAQPNINAQEYGGLQLLLPSKQTQNQFVALAQQSDKSKFELEQTLVALTRTTRKLLSQSFG
jgi:type I restriction enzyme S subunit